MLAELVTALTLAQQAIKFYGRMCNSLGTTLETNSEKVRLVQPNVVARYFQG